ncbi:hypothetical protein [Caudoviricetes sp.]|nr:hypothetical protein [Caudoviricetes sp.]
MSDLATAPVSEAPEAAPVVSTPVETVEARNEGTYVPGEQTLPDTESRARAMGWVPKEEYKGNPDNWRDAGEFVRRGEEILPIVQERNRDLTRRLTELETRLAQRDASYETNIKKLEGMTAVALQRQREQLLGSYEGAMRQAAASADVERYDQLSRDRDHQLNQFDQRIAQTVRQPEVQPQQQTPPEAQEWADRNASWFLKDPALNMEAQAIHIALQREHPYMPLADNLARVEQTIKQRYPQKFGVRTSSQPSVSYGAVEGGGSRIASGGSRQRGVSELPADAKAQGEKFVKQGLFKDLAEYAREYHAQS